MIPRLAPVVAAALLAAACSALPGATPTTAPSTTAPPTTGAPSTTSTTGAGSSTTTTTAAPFTVADCEEPGDFAILCETVDLIERHYVDEVDLSELAAAAAEGVEDAGPAGYDLATCAIPTEDFTVVCEALSEQGTEPVEGVEAAVARMVASLDPNSFYLDAEGLALIEEEQQGRVEGIGALVATEDLTAEDPASAPCQVLSDTCRLVIVSTLEGPARRAGVLAGDVFVEVDGEPVLGATVDEITSQVRGPAGTDVDITMSREGELVTFTITRESIDIPIAVWESTGGGVGYLRLYLFSENADEQVHEGLEELIAAGATTVVFDLRDNPGGSLDSAVGVASEFLDDGLVLRTIEPDRETPYPVRDGGAATDPEVEVVVVLNRGSASASEVVAGVLQERERATLVGERSFGKNTVQQRFGLSNGGAVRLTIARWTTPDGLDFGSTGLTPDTSGEFETTATPAQVVAQALSLTG